MLCSEFISGPSAWPYVLVATTIADGAASQAAQTYTMNITSLPAGGANMRVYKTTANGNDFFGSPVPLTLGSNSITVPSVTFDRAVKFQFSSGDVEFDALSLNGVNTNCVGTLLPIYGCTDASAINYNSTATIDDGSCTYPIDCAGVVNGTSVLDSCGVCQSAYIYNFITHVPTYVSNANSLVPMLDYNPSQEMVVLPGDPGDPNWNSSCSGCTDPSQSNYNPAATIDDGSCIPFTFGCMDPLAMNYNASATADDGSCLYAGCTDPAASNYDPMANFDDGSCIIATTCSEPSPTGLFVSDIIHDRVVINWDNMNSATCFVDQYRIKYRIQGTSSWSNKTMGAPVGSCTFPSNKTDKRIGNLTPSSTYEYQMKAWYCGGASGWSAINTFTTLDNCPNVGNLAVSTPTTTKATFTWDDSNGPYSFTRLKARVDSISNPTGSDFFSIGGAGVQYPTFTKNKNGLVPGETYRGQARTWCDPNGGAYRSPSWTSLVYWTQPTVRIEGGESITNLDVYPNPSRDVFNVTFTSDDVQDLGG